MFQIKLTDLTAVLLLATLASSSVVHPPSKKTSDTFELLILHNNDMHARFEQTSQLSGACTTSDREAGKCYGGFPRVAHVVKEARQAAASGEGPPVLYLNAGDTYTGTAWFTIYKWKIAAEFINALQPDAVSLGNHELDNGISGLTPFIRNLTCPVLAANLILTKEPTLKAEPNLKNSVVFDVNGTKVGVIGYLTPETKILATRNDIEYIDEVQAIKDEVEILKTYGIKIFIALGHSGFTKDLEIAKEVKDIDLVIGGHTNTFLWNGTSPDVEKVEGPYPTLVKQASGRLVPAVQAYAYTKYLGKLIFLFDSEGEIISFDGNPILLDNSIPQDPDVLQIVEKYKEEIMKKTEVVVGNTSVVIDGHTCRVQECNMGNLIADAMIFKYASEYTGDGWTDAPIAIIQGGAIRSSVSRLELPTEVTVGDLLTVMPFDGNMVKVTLIGKDVLEMLEHAVKKYALVSPRAAFLQVSGLYVEYDLKKKPGSRVKKVLVRCGLCTVPEFTPLEKNEYYNILMPSFLSMGGDGYFMFNDKPTLPLAYDELKSTIYYIQRHGLIYPAVEGRTSVNNVNLMSSASTSTISAIIICMALIRTLLL